MTFMRRIQRNGVITIPKELRQKTKLREGDYVAIDYQDGKITIVGSRATVHPISPVRADERPVVRNFTEMRNQRALRFHRIAPQSNLPKAA